MNGVELAYEAPNHAAESDTLDLEQGLGGLDLRLITALAGDRELNAREQGIVAKLKEERGESLYSDVLYTLTHKTFPSRQAKLVWQEIISHRTHLTRVLKRDTGISVAAHDYLTNITQQLKNAAIIEETKFTTLRDVARRDGLTGLFDKASFLRHLDTEIERTQRYNTPLTLIMADIDHFKHLNDTFGHADGDIALTQVAHILQQSARATDTVARYGGEEFAVIMPGVTTKEALVYAERVRCAVEETFKDTFKTTLSLGIATVGSDNVTRDSLVRKADEHLYKAKRNGRNQISAHN